MIQEVNWCANLIEYERFKDAAGSLVARERVWRDSFTRDPLPVPTKEIEVEAEEEVWTEDLQIFDLLSALQGVLDRAPSDTYVDVVRENWTVEERIQDGDGALGNGSYHSLLRSCLNNSGRDH